MKSAQALPAQDVFGEVGLALFQNFAHADDGCESGFERGLQFEVYGIVGLAEILAALGVSDDYVGAADASSMPVEFRR